MKKGDLVKRVHISANYEIDELEIGEVGVIVKGPYEKNVSDIVENSRHNYSWPKFVEIKRVIDGKQ